MVTHLLKATEFAPMILKKKTIGAPFAPFTPQNQEGRGVVSACPGQPFHNPCRTGGPTRRPGCGAIQHAPRLFRTQIRLSQLGTSGGPGPSTYSPLWAPRSPPELPRSPRNSPHAAVDARERSRPGSRRSVVAARRASAPSRPGSAVAAPRRGGRDACGAYAVADATENHPQMH